MVGSARSQDSRSVSSRPTRSLLPRPQLGTVTQQRPERTHRPLHARQHQTAMTGLLKPAPADSEELCEKILPEGDGCSRVPIVRGMSTEIIELAVDVVGQVNTVIDDVGPPDRQNRVAVRPVAGRQEPMRVYGNEPRHPGQLCPGLTDRFIGIYWALSPS